MLTLNLDEDELFIISEFVRQSRTAPEYGEEHDRDFIERVWAAILRLQEPDKKGHSIKIAFSSGELLQITRQVSAFITQGTRPIGREIIRKAAAAILAQEAHHAVPDVYYTGEDDGAESNMGTSEAAGP